MNGQKLEKKKHKKIESTEHPEDILLFPHNNPSNETSFSKQ